MSGSIFLVSMSMCNIHRINNSPHNVKLISHRNVTSGTTGATAVAPEFPDMLTLFQPEGIDSVPTLQKLHQIIPCGYISVSA